MGDLTFARERMIRYFCGTRSADSQSIDRCNGLVKIFQSTARNCPLSGGMPKLATQILNYSVFPFAGPRQRSVPSLAGDDHGIFRAVGETRNAEAGKDTTGKLTGDKKLQSEGKLDKAKGAAHEAAGNVKDAIRDLTK